MGTTNTRRKLRSKLSTYLNKDDDDNDDDTSDNFEINRGIGNYGRQRRQSNELNNNIRQQEQQQSITTKLDELLDDEDSDMARYLLSGKKREGSCFARCRRKESNDANNNVDDMQADMISMGKYNTDAYSMSLEPIGIRSEKIIMLAEGESAYIYDMFMFDFLEKSNTLSYTLSLIYSSLFNCKYIY